MAGRQGVEPCRSGLESEVRSRRATYKKAPWSVSRLTRGL